MSGSRGITRTVLAAGTMGLSEVYRATAKAVLPKKDDSGRRRASILAAENDALREDISLKEANQRAWVPRTVAPADTSVFAPQTTRKTLLGGY